MKIDVDPKFIVSVGVKSAIEEYGRRSGEAYNLENALNDFNQDGDATKLAREIEEFKSELGCGSYTSIQQERLKIYFNQILRGLES